MFAFLHHNARWLTVGALLTFVSSFGQTFFISLFAGQIQSDFDLTHGEWGSIYSIATLGSAFVMVWAGIATDVLRVRVLVPIVLIGLALACLWMSQANAAWMLIPIIFLLRFGGQGMSSHIAVVAMSRWFVKSRGKALSIATLGFALGEATLPIIVVAAFAVMAWQTIWVIAACAAVGLVPLLMWMLTSERTPQAIAKETQSTGMQSRHWTRLQVLSHPLFWMMVPALLGPPAFNTAFFFHQVHFASVKGLDHIQIVQFFPFYTLIGIGSMLVFGWALDKWGTSRLLPLHQVPIAAAFACFAVSTGPIMIGIGFVFLGLTAGATATLPNAFWAEYFGTRHLGSIKSMAAAIMVLGSGIGPGITGILLDQGIAISTQYQMISAYFVMTTVILTIGFAIVRSRTVLPSAP